MRASLPYTSSQIASGRQTWHLPGIFGAARFVKGMAIQTVRVRRIGLRHDVCQLLCYLGQGSGYGDFDRFGGDDVYRNISLMANNRLVPQKNQTQPSGLWRCAVQRRPMEAVS